MNFEEVIIAKATAAGGAFRGILRLSGTGSLLAVRRLFQPDIDDTAAGDGETFVQTGSLFPWDNSVPVPAKIFHWQNGKSYTGQESVEIHTIGSPPVLDAITTAVCRSGLARPAGHGEFTLRAFLSGKIDLTQAEGVLGVIEAENSEMLEKALQQLAGGIAAPLKQIRLDLFDALSRFEAGLDFAEEDIDFITKEELLGILETALRETLALQQKMELRNCGNEKPLIVLSGLPNAGKSTLFNTLLGQQKAITSPAAGTTRDYLEAAISFGGIDCILIDTAGIDENTDTQLPGQKEAKERLPQADIVIECCECNSEIPQTETRKRIITVFTKSDKTAQIHEDMENTVSVSAITGFGIDELKSEIERQLRTIQNAEQTVLPSTALRCCDALAQAVSSLRCAVNGLTGGSGIFDETVLAAEMRSAVNSLGLIDGTVHTEDLLDNIFSKFCIGK